MVLGTTVEDVEENIVKRRVGELIDEGAEKPEWKMMGLSAYEICCAIWDREENLSCLHLQIPSTEDKSYWFDRVGDQMPIINGLARTLGHIKSNKVSILGVSSLTRKDGKHWIVSKGYKLYDPQDNGLNEHVYKNLNDHAPLCIDTAILIEGL